MEVYAGTTANINYFLQILVFLVQVIENKLHVYGATTHAPCRNEEMRRRSIVPFLLMPDAQGRPSVQSLHWHEIRNEG